MSYQSPRSLQDKWGGRLAARTPIYHHLMCIKARSPLIVKTNKKAASITGSNRQEADGVQAGAGLPSSPASPPSAEAQELGSGPCVRRAGPVGRPALPTASSPSPVMPRTEEETEAPGCLWPAGVPQGRRWAALACPVPPAGTARALVVQSSGTRVQGATSFTQSSQARKGVWARLPCPGTWGCHVRGRGTGHVVLELCGTLGLGQMFAGPGKRTPCHRNLEIPA